VGCTGGTDPACSSSAAVKLSDLQVSVFTPSCATGGCHRGTLPAEGLDLSDGKAFASLMGKRSQLDPSVALVTAKEPSSSELYIQVHAKLMPLEGGNEPPLSDAQIQQVAGWICAGAPNN
jgi:hypothetical protein